MPFVALDISLSVSASLSLPPIDPPTQSPQPSSTTSDSTSTSPSSSPHSSTPTPTSEQEQTTRSPASSSPIDPPLNSHGQAPTSNSVADAGSNTAQSTDGPPQSATSLQSALTATIGVSTLFQSIVTVDPGAIETKTAVAGSLNPSQDQSPDFFHNKGAVAGLFTVLGIIVLAAIAGVVGYLRHRRKSVQDDEFVEKIMSGHGSLGRSPIDGDDDYSQLRPTGSQRSLGILSSNAASTESYARYPVTEHADRTTHEYQDIEGSHTYEAYHANSMDTWNNGLQGSRPSTMIAFESDRTLTTESSHMSHKWPTPAPLPPHFGAASPEPSVLEPEATEESMGRVLKVANA